MKKKKDWIPEEFRKQNIKDLVIDWKYGVKGEERDFSRMIP